jgi:hypothetical protein
MLAVEISAKREARVSVGGGCGDGRATMHTSSRNLPECDEEQCQQQSCGTRRYGGGVSVPSLTTGGGTDGDDGFYTIRGMTTRAHACTYFND